VQVDYRYFPVEDRLRGARKGSGTIWMMVARNGNSWISIESDLDQSKLVSFFPQDCRRIDGEVNKAGSETPGPPGVLVLVGRVARRGNGLRQLGVRASMPSRCGGHRPQPNTGERQSSFEQPIYGSAFSRNALGPAAGPQSPGLEIPPVPGAFCCLFWLTRAQSP
jgi:hypothetical protein